MKKLLQKELSELITLIDDFSQKFGENDIRPAFLDGYFQILRTYYCAHFQLDSDDILTKYREIYPDANLKREDISARHLQGHKNLLNSFLIINCWSNFELFVTLFSQKVLPQNEIDDLLNGDYNNLKKILNGYKLDNNTEEKLKKMVRHNLAHVPMPSKYGKLLKMIAKYPGTRNVKEDREFLEFFGRLRNCIHSNYIFYGAEEKVYSFNGEKFTFTPDKVLSHYPAEDSSIFKLTLNIKEIFLLIVQGIPYSNEIFDPSMDLEVH